MLCCVGCMDGDRVWLLRVLDRWWKGVKAVLLVCVAVIFTICPGRDVLCVCALMLMLMLMLSGS